MAVCGPSCCGKTQLIFKMLLVGTVFPEFQTIYYFYQHDQPIVPIVREETEHTFKKFFNFELIPVLENCLLVFDELEKSEEILIDKEFSNLATAGQIETSV